MKKIHGIFALAILLLAFACKPSTTTPASTTDGDSAAAAAQQTPAVNPDDVKLVCREIRDLNDMSPLSEVSLHIGSQVILVDSINACEVITTDMWENYEIPKDAKMAVGGWWAGAGDYFYLKIDGNDAVVMYGWAAEEVEEKDLYQYEEVKRVKIN